MPQHGGTVAGWLTDWLPGWLTDYPGLVLRHGSTAINLAAESGHSEVVALLLDKGACITTADNVSSMADMGQRH